MAARRVEHHDRAPRMVLTGVRPRGPGLVPERSARGARAAVMVPVARAELEVGVASTRVPPRPNPEALSKGPSARIAQATAFFA